MVDIYQGEPSPGASITIPAKIKRQRKKNSNSPRKETKKSIVNSEEEIVKEPEINEEEKETEISEPIYSHKDYEKELSKLGFTVEDIIVVDNSVYCISISPNGVPSAIDITFDNSKPPKKNSFKKSDISPRPSIHQAKNTGEKYLIKSGAKIYIMKNNKLEAFKHELDEEDFEFFPILMYKNIIEDPIKQSEIAKERYIVMIGISYRDIIPIKCIVGELENALDTNMSTLVRLENYRKEHNREGGDKAKKAIKSIKSEISGRLRDASRISVMCNHISSGKRNDLLPKIREHCEKLRKNKDTLIYAR